MSDNVTLLERDVRTDSCLIESLFSSTFSMADLIQGADAAGYEMGSEELSRLGDTSRMADTNATIRFKLTGAHTAEVIEISNEEVELVTGGVLLPPVHSAYSSFVNTNTVTNITAAVAVFVVVGGLTVLIVATAVA